LGATGQLSSWLNYELTSYVSTSKLGASFVQSPDRALMIQRSPEIVYGVEGFLHFTPVKWIQFGGSYSWMEGITSPKDDGIILQRSITAEFQLQKYWPMFRETYSCLINRAGYASFFQAKQI
jgi:hypothetical protein